MPAGKIGSLTICNGLIQTAMGPYLAIEGGLFGDQLIAYYEAHIELAEFVHERGRKVTVVNNLAQLGQGLPPRTASGAA